MKTPHEILLERHRAAQPKLDRLRQEVLSQALAREAPAALGRGQVVARVALTAWQELIWPSRRTWAGLAAAWLALAAINIQRRVAVKASPGGSSVPASDFAQAFEEQRRVLAELLQPAIALPAEPPRPGPRPRSERPMGTKVGRLDSPRQAHPEGMIENSPTFQRWEREVGAAQVPKGRLTGRAVSAVPSGLVVLRALVPNVETLGYFRMSLRDTDLGRFRGCSRGSSPGVIEPTFLSSLRDAFDLGNGLPVVVRPAFPRTTTGCLLTTLRVVSIV